MVELKASVEWRVGVEFRSADGKWGRSGDPPDSDHGRTLGHVHWKWSFRTRKRRRSFLMDNTR